MKKYNLKRVLLWLAIVLVFLGFEAHYIRDSHYMGEYDALPAVNLSELSDEKAVLEQEFTSTHESIDGVVVSLNSSFSNQIKASLYVENEKKQSWKIVSSDIVENRYKFVLDKGIKNAKGKRIKMVLEVEKMNEIPLSDQIQEENEMLTINGEVKPNAILSYSVLEDNVSRKEVFFVVALVTLIVLIMYVVLNNKCRNLKIEHVFIYGYVIMGIIQFFAIPIFKTPDEGAHFLRSYELSMGYLVSEKKFDDMNNAQVGRELPEALNFGSEVNWTNIKLYDLEKLAQYSIDQDKQTFIGFSNTALYAPATYLPQVLGIKLVSLFSNNALVIAYAARLFNWLITGLILLFAIHYIPIGKKLLFLVSFLPMNMQQFNSMSPDAFTFALCMGMVAFVLYQKFSMIGKMKWYHYVLMYGLIIGLSQCKIVYIVFCALLFLIPMDRFVSKKKYVMHVVVSIVIMLSICLIWLNISSGMLIEFQPGVDSAQQVKNILSNPLEYVGIMIKTVDTFGDSWLRQMLGENLGWLNISTSYSLLMCYATLIVVCIFRDADVMDYTLSKGNRVFLFSCMFLIMILICTSIYVQWTAAGSDIIYGIQGRYFLPILVPLLLAIRPAYKYVATNTLDFRYIICFVFGINICVSTILFINAL